MFRSISLQRLFICVITGFSSGLPFYVLISLLPAWFKDSNVDLKTIALFSLIQIPFTLKFLWAPFLDNIKLPFGRRRGWCLITQFCLLIGIIGFAFFSPVKDVTSVVVLSLSVAFFSASQDIVLDAYRREILLDKELGLGNVIHVNAYRISSLIPGSLGLILADHISWGSVFIITAVFMLPGIILMFYVAEPLMAESSKIKTYSIKKFIMAPFQEFVHRKGWHLALLILAFVCLYKLGDSIATALATPFYLEMGYSKTEIGLVVKNAGLWGSILGGVVGGFCLLKISLFRALWIFGILQTLPILGFAWLSLQQPDLWKLGFIVAGESFGSGLGTSAFIAFIAQQTNPLYAGTQLSLLTSLSAIPRTLINATTGYWVESIGWYYFFGFCFLSAIPGLLLLRWMYRNASINA